MGVVETLTVEQLEKLNNGESIEVDSMSTNVEIHPPCEENGHEWRDPRVVGKKEGGAQLRRSCAKCGDTQECSPDFDLLFEEREGLWD